MRVFFVASEVTPIAKVGGLGDVIGALPKALTDLGVDTLIITGYYGSHREKEYPTEVIAQLSLPWGGQLVNYFIRRGYLPGSKINVYFIDQPDIIGSGDVYHSRTAIASSEAEAERFLFLSKTASTLPEVIGLKPDVWHLHDWHAAAVTVFLPPGSAPTLLTIHNLSNQGWVSKATALKAGLEGFSHNSLAGDINLFRLGLERATWLSTVSPTYAREIQAQPLGEGLEGIISAKRERLVGIVNGLDIDFFDPEKDKFLLNKLAGDLDDFKIKNRQLLAKTLGLKPLNCPLLGIVSRLTNQKGIDLIVDALKTYLTAGRVQWVCLGRGDPILEKAVSHLAERYPKLAAVKIDFDEPLAHLIYAASDFFLMPSRFEPCGLGQLIAMRYATIPIVRATGGLKDTVIDISRPAGNGVVFNDYTPQALEEAIGRALELYSNRDKMKSVRHQARQRDSSWMVAARQYLKLYERLCLNSGLN